jgi:hypothetical protein
MSQDARTKANTLKTHNARRMYRRQHDEAFAESERSSNRKHRASNREFSRLGHAFIRTHSHEFEVFLKGKLTFVRPATTMQNALNDLKSQGLDLA